MSLASLIGLVLFACLTWPVYAYSNAKTWLDADFVAHAFLEVALKNEYSAGDKPLVKWKQPIKIWVEHKVPDIRLHNQLTNAHLKDLNRITGHPIERVAARQQANVAVSYTHLTLPTIA